MPKIFLIADIGGTNARFALSESGDSNFKSTSFKSKKTLQCKDYETIDSAVDAYLLEQDVPAIDGICIAAAGPVINDAIKLTNNHWIIESSALKHRFGVKQIKLLNDWESIAYALPIIKEADLQPIGRKWQPVQEERMVIGALGPGSGLGVGGIYVSSEGQFPLITEGGHSGFAPENPYQLELLKTLQHRFDHVSNERLLSGPGLINIYEAVCEIEGVARETLTAEKIATMGTESKEGATQKTMSLFFEILGQVAGDLALTLGANAGIFIGGGICQRYPGSLVNSRFRDGFEHKGHHSLLLKQTPTWLILHKDPGLLGASVYAQTKMTSP